MGLIVWAIIGVVVGFALSALASRKFNHRLAPAVLLVLCIIALATARWAGGQFDAESAALQARAYIFGHALLGAVFGGFGWLIFARQLWAMAASAVLSAAYLLTLPLSVPVVACFAAGICR